MNIGEANDVGAVIDELLNVLRGDPTGDVLKANRIRAAALRLAERAYKTLHAGADRREQVLEQMPEHCADEMVDDDVTRYCYQPAGHDGPWHDDLDYMWPVEAGDGS